FSSSRRHARFSRDWSSDVCSSDLVPSYMTVVATPFSFNGLIGKGSHHLELGIGITPMYFKERNIQVGGSYIDDNGNVTIFHDKRSEERRVGKDCELLWSLKSCTIV